MAASLGSLGVGRVYGVIGEETSVLAAAIIRHDIEWVTCRHEQAAGFLAANEGRLTGRPGVCCTTLGPGVTNVATALAHAQLGGMPMLLLCGQKPLRDNAEGTFQVLDLISTVDDLSNRATRVIDPLEANAATAAALLDTLAPRPGVAVLELAVDLLDEAVPAIGPSPSIELVRRWADGDDLATAAARIAARIDRADRPLIVAGAGAIRHGDDIVDLLDRHPHLSALTTQMAAGTIPYGHDASLRSIGTNGVDYVDVALEQTDLIVAVGYDPVEHPPQSLFLSPDTPIVHFASWSPSIIRGYEPVDALVVDLSTSIRLTHEALGAPADRPARPFARVRSIIDRLLEDERTELRATPGEPTTVIDLIDRLEAVGDVSIALDNGIYKVWFARHFFCERPGHLLLDNALATMGAGVATAMAAALHERRASGAEGKQMRSIAVVGDGGLLMTLNTLQTLVDTGLDTIVIVVRDDQFGFIDWKQADDGRERVATELSNPDLGLIAKGFGIAFARSTTVDDLQPAIDAALERNGPTLIDVPTQSIDDVLSDGGPLAGDEPGHTRATIARRSLGES